MTKAALLSVSDRTGIVEFAKGLSERGFKILTTSGTGKHLSENGIESVSIEDYTGQDEILDGRVKTLHPKIHAGILARQDVPEHMSELDKAGIYPLGIVAVNLYPFTQRLNSGMATDPAAMIESIDIGGPSMIRGAAKNFSSLYPIIDPADYGKVLECLDVQNQDSSDLLEFRKSLALKIFADLADYNLQIARYFSHVNYTDSTTVDNSTGYRLGEVEGEVLRRSQVLRYGENPHQSGAYYQPVAQKNPKWEQHGGKALSYNNLLDVDAAIRFISSVGEKSPTSGIFKHLNPCGAAYADTLVQSVKLSKLGDTRSHFGGIVACNMKLDLDTAKEITSDFKEIVVAPDYDADALEELNKKKNLRVIRVLDADEASFEVRTAAGGYLYQQQDKGALSIEGVECVSERKPTEQEMLDLELAWNLVSHVKSNAITFVKNGTLAAAGAGQMSRIDSTEIAISKAKEHGHNIQGAVAASDAFFPFTDNIEAMARAGICAVIAPSGAKQDDEVVAKANELGISFLFASTRHFRH